MRDCFDLTDLIDLILSCDCCVYLRAGGSSALSFLPGSALSTFVSSLASSSLPSSFSASGITASLPNSGEFSLGTGEGSRSGAYFGSSAI